MALCRDRATPASAVGR